MIKAFSYQILESWYNVNGKFEKSPHCDLCINTVNFEEVEILKCIARDKRIEYDIETSENCKFSEKTPPHSITEIQSKWYSFKLKMVRTEEIGDFIKFLNKEH